MQAKTSKKAKRRKRQFDIVMSGQFCTLAMFIFLNTLWILVIIEKSFDSFITNIMEAALTPSQIC